MWRRINQKANTGLQPPHLRFKPNYHSSNPPTNQGILLHCNQPPYRSSMPERSYSGHLHFSTSWHTTAVQQHGGIQALCSANAGPAQPNAAVKTLVSRFLNYPSRLQFIEGHKSFRPRPFNKNSTSSPNKKF